MKRYPSRYEGEGTAPGRCIRLLDETSVGEGTVLDLGCGRAPLAEAVRERDLEYVGVDVDQEALTEVASRGFEVHRRDLAGNEDELLGALRQIVAERPVAAVLAVDLIEHLIEPQALLRAVRELVGEDTSLIVSAPNVTHLNVAAKLLLGRWDLTEWGLLDDTHLRFFSEGLLIRLFECSGWRQVGAADAENPDTPDQLFPPDAPGLRNGTPSRELLRRLRSDSDPHAATYQFVRRFLPTPTARSPFRWALEPAGEPGFATILVDAGTGPVPRELIRADLAAQTWNDLDVVEVDPAQGWNAAVTAARGRYLCFLDGRTRVSPRWIESFAATGNRSPGRVLRAAAVSVPAQRLAGDRDPSALVGSGQPLEINPLDLLAPGRPGPTVLSAYAVPADLVRAAGLRFESGAGSATVVFLARAAELCGVGSVDAATVAVADTIEPDSESDLDAVATALDRSPIVMPAGSVARMIDLRRGLFETQQSLSWRITKPLRLRSWVQRRRGRR